MDKRFRISFFPSDASRVKELSVSRRLGIALAAVIAPLSALGIWLVFAGPLHEPSESAQLRRKLAQENRALGGRVGKLDADLQSLRKALSRLEEEKMNALLLSGIGYAEEEQRSGAGRLFSFFQDAAPLAPDPAVSLMKARALSLSLDSSLSLLADRASLVEGIPTVYPVDREAIVTREFGFSPDPFTGRKALHAGVDFSVRSGAPVFASGAGTVVEAGKDLLWGWFVRIDHGRDVFTFYAHLDKALVERGQSVARGETIGLMGMSGVATGVHLHYELAIHGSKTDPMHFFLPELVVSTGAPRPVGAAEAGGGGGGT